MQVELRKKTIGQRIDAARYVLILFIAYVHVPPFVALANTPNEFFDWFRAFFVYGLFRCTAPILSVVSGYLFFRGRGATQGYRSLIARKTLRLGVPFILCNAPLVIGLYYFQSHGMFDGTVNTQLAGQDILTLLNYMVGITVRPLNTPLYFVRDLFVIFLFSPIIIFLLRRAPYIGLALVAIVFLNNFDGLLIFRNDIAVNFYVGGLIATRKWDVLALDRFRIIALMALLVICTVLVGSK